MVIKNIKFLFLFILLMGFSFYLFSSIMDVFAASSSFTPYKYQCIYDVAGNKTEGCSLSCDTGFQLECGATPSVSGNSASGPTITYDRVLTCPSGNNYFDCFQSLTSYCYLFAVFYDRTVTQPTPKPTPKPEPEPEPEEFELTVSKDGEGSGTIRDSEDTFSCGVDCEEKKQKYTEGTEVRLVAEPADDSEFKRWSGDCDFFGRLTMDEDKSCSAFFQQYFTVSIIKKGSQEGTVTEPYSYSADAIDCGEVCERSYIYDSDIELRISPPENWEIDSISGCDSSAITESMIWGQRGRCEIDNIQENKEVTVSFIEVSEVFEVSSVSHIFPTDFCGYEPIDKIKLEWNVEGVDNDQQENNRINIVDQNGDVCEFEYEFQTFWGGQPRNISARDINNKCAEFIDYNNEYTWKVQVQNLDETWSDWSEEDSFSTPKHEWPKVNFDTADEEISLSNMSIRAGEEVSFVDKSSCVGGCRDYKWDFNEDWRIDSTEQNPTYIFDSGGTYEIRETVTDNSGYTCPCSKTARVFENSAPRVGYQSVTKNDYCTNPGHCFTWNYFDSNGHSQSKYQFQVDSNNNFNSPEVDRTVEAPSNNQQTVVVSVNSVSNQLNYNTEYYWRVKAWDEYGAESDWTEGPPFNTEKHRYPSIDFDWDPQESNEEEEVQFTDQSTVYGGAVKQSWSWTFEDGNPAFSGQKNPIVNFINQGEKEVFLSVTDSDGYSCPLTKIISIKKIEEETPIWREVLPW